MQGIGYSELVKRVERYSGSSNKESEDSLQLIIEAFAARLEESERSSFADQLPEELQELALAPLGTEKFTADEMADQLSAIENKRLETQNQFKAVWHVLKETLSGKQIARLQPMLPRNLQIDL